MIPDGRDCTKAKMSNGPTMNGNKPKINKPKEMNKENEQNASNIDGKNSIIETVVANEISSELKNKETKDKVQKSPVVYKLVLTGGPCSGEWELITNFVFNFIWISLLT